MLQIKNISKQYKTGDLIQNALNDVSLNFRDNEFVSILGPSGSGKTTLLNIIGGLDRYDKGNLIINNISTQNYKDRDWDSYRNHTIGFVFQSYNLIPHQTVLANVELSLTISGVSKKERRKRALATLEKVGLKEQAHKRPNQMSGGQMQRVAIARALINDPDILLADEPTGALDTETSVQVMELLKQVANDRLVIMVTHNPELAEQYSTRIVKLKDGKIIGDTDPFEVDEAKIEKPKDKNMGKSSMSFLTALSLSFNNLLTKKGRTILTSFAGSIGIIGIALILSLSTGFQNYIDKIQEDTLTSYPLTITQETADTTSMLLSMVEENDEDVEGQNVKETQNITNMLTKIGTNDLGSLKKYFEENEEKLNDMVSLCSYKYSIQPLIYTKDVTEKITQLNPNKLFEQLSGGSEMNASSMGMSVMSVFNEMIDDRQMVESQYDVLAGKYPENANEVILILPDANSISDLLLYTLGLRDMTELESMLSKLMEGKEVENKNEPLEFTYEQLMNIDLRLINPTDTYKYNSKYNIYESMTEDEAFMKNVYDNAYQLKIVGIVCPKSGSNATSLSMGISYTKELTEHIINLASQSEIVKKQLENEDINVFSNKRFDEKSNDTGLDFNDMISIDTDMLSSAFGMNINQNDIAKMTEKYMQEISASITADTTKAKETFIKTLKEFTKNVLNDYIKENEVAGITSIKLEDVDKMIEEAVKLAKNKELFAELEKQYSISKDTFEKMYKELVKEFLKQYISNMSPNEKDPTAIITKDAVEKIVNFLTEQEKIDITAAQTACKMIEATMQKVILTKVGELTGKLMENMASAFKVDESKIAAAFQFNLNEEELKRLFEALTTKGTESADNNLRTLGYQDLEEPSAISLYFKDFDSKEKFIDFLEDYNKKMEETDEDKVIKYTDITGFLMSSVKVIVDSVSYVLIAFVSISLIVSSIMIGIITYISVLERTKEIGVLRAIGASKRNISSIFNAETFIVGLFAGLIGIGVTLLLLHPINAVIHGVTNNMDITAVLPMNAAIVLVILSVILTLIGGIIPSRHAAKKDPVLALRSE